MAIDYADYECRVVLGVTLHLFVVANTITVKLRPEGPSVGELAHEGGDVWRSSWDPDPRSLQGHLEILARKRRPF